MTYLERIQTHLRNRGWVREPFSTDFGTEVYTKKTRVCLLNPFQHTITVYRAR